MEKYLKKLNKKAKKHFNIKNKHFKKIKLDYSLNSFRILGQYSPKNKTIYINQKLIDKVGEKAYYEVFRHEYGHFITDMLYPYAAAHGREWKSIMRILGDKRPSATNSNFSKKIRKAYKDSFVKVECKCSEFKISNNKATRIKNKTSKYRCSYCKSKIKIK